MIYNLITTSAGAILGRFRCRLTTLHIYVGTVLALLVIVIA